MKKIIVVISAIVCSLSISAASLTARCFITLTSNNGGTDVVKIFENPDYDNTYVNGIDALKNMNAGNATNLNIYSVQGTTNVAEVRTDAIENLPIVVETNEVGTTFTMTFSYVQGTIKLYDLVADPTGANPKTLVSGDTYEFTVASAARQTIADRFVLNYVAPAPVAPAICFKYNKLELTKYDGATVEVFADGAATAALTQVVAGDAQFDIDLSALASGKYKVVVTIPGVATPEEYIIDVKPAVTVVP